MEANDDVPLYLLKESLMTLEAARRKIPTRPCYGTIRRWCKVGYHGVILESIMCGNYRCTSTEALTRFLTKINQVKIHARKPRS